MIHIEPLGTERLLPAFMVGYKLPLPKKPDLLADLPRWIITMHQQAGGYCMSYPSVVGVVLRLEANSDKGKQHLGHLIRGLKCMAEGSNEKILRSEYALLDRIAYTDGKEYPNTDLRDLETFVSTYLSMPAIISGVEAFIRCAPCDPMSYFAGWKMLECSWKNQEERSNCYIVNSDDLFDLNLIDETDFNEGTVQTLVHLAETCGASNVEPDVFLLWENSD